MNNSIEFNSGMMEIKNQSQTGRMLPDHQSSKLFDSDLVNQEISRQMIGNKNTRAKFDGFRNSLDEVQLVGNHRISNGRADSMVLNGFLDRSLDISK